MKRKTHAVAADQGAVPPRDEEGLLNDEYSDASFVERDRVDALDVPALLEGESALDDVPADHDGIESVPESADAALVSPLSTTDDGHVQLADGNEMGIGTELYSVDDLERATIGAPRARKQHPTKHRTPRP
jgi:hypothetical protein